MDDAMRARGYRYAVAWVREGLDSGMHLVDVYSHAERAEVERAIRAAITDLETTEQRLSCAHEWHEREEVDVDSRSFTAWMECPLCGATKPPDGE